jgi:hypothetical protein
MWKLENTEGTWQQMMSRKDLNNQVLAHVEVGQGCSHFWQSLLSVNAIFEQYSERVMHNGEKTLFWVDKWVNDSPLAVQLLKLYHPRL